MRQFTLLLFTLLIILTFVPVVHAQDVPIVELSGGATFVPLVQTSVTPGEDVVTDEGARQGFFGSGTFNLNDVFGIEVEAKATYGRFVPDSSHHVYQTSLLAGTRFSYRELHRDVVPYFHVLAGPVYRPYLLSHTGYSLMLDLGVGANLYFSKRLGVNVGASYSNANFLRGHMFDQGSINVGLTVRR